MELTICLSRNARTYKQPENTSEKEHFGKIGVYVGDNIKTDIEKWNVRL
jgi:hypothetical protein